ncbi:MAG: single-stranded DNA-binding protein [Chlamydiia bacterium]|nr:single-stranded DNA-binding protein [Chlamydiia bacterium]
MPVLVNFIGRLHKDVATKTTKNNKSFKELSLVSSNFSTKGEVSLWWSGVIWEESLQKLENRLKNIKKGSLLLIEGQLNEVQAYKNRDDGYSSSISINIHNIKFLPTSKSQDSEKSTNGFEDNVYDSDSENPF